VRFGYLHAHQCGRVHRPAPTISDSRPSRLPSLRPPLPAFRLSVAPVPLGSRRSRPPCQAPVRSVLSLVSAFQSAECRVLI
jgi:hypothetical protein